jgi:hypothetical protein
MAQDLDVQHRDSTAIGIDSMRVINAKGTPSL